MMNYDITSASDAINTISLLTGVRKIDIQSFIAKNIISDGCFHDGTSMTGKNFNKEYGLSTASRHVDEICFCGVHYTSNDDENVAIQNFGLRDLQFSLSADTPLKRFLSEHDIHFNVEAKTMAIGTKIFDISYHRGSFDIDNPISYIARKVYYDNALSCFLYIEDITRYLGDVHVRPEVLCDIDRINSNLQLSHEWEQRCTAYEVKFASPLKLFEEYSFKEKNEDLYESLIEKALLVAGEMSNGEIFAYMKPVSVIPNNQIIGIRKIGRNANP